MRWFFVRESIGIRKDSIPVSPGKRNWRPCFRFSCGRDWSLLAASSLLTPLSISEVSKTREWRALRDSNLSRFAGVSEAGVPDTRGFRVAGWEAGARRRNPERSEGSLDRYSCGKDGAP